MITIRKYNNRRLYDTSASRYVNLDELADLVRDGQDIEVVDAKTGEDLTREVLLQVVMEVLKASDFFPVGLLRRIIRFSQAGPAYAAMRQQLVMGLDLLFIQLDRLESMAGPPPGARARKPAPPEPEPPAEEPASPAQERAELDALRARLSDLEQRLGR